jgi:hypothetical protein
MTPSYVSSLYYGKYVDVSIRGLCSLLYCICLHTPHPEWCHQRLARFKDLWPLPMFLHYIMVNMWNMCLLGSLLTPILYLSTHPAPWMVPPENSEIHRSMTPSNVSSLYYGKYVDVSIGVSAHSFTVSVYTTRTLLGATRETSQMHTITEHDSLACSLFESTLYTWLPSLLSLSVYTPRTLLGAIRD